MPGFNTGNMPISATFVDIYHYAYKARLIRSLKKYYLSSFDSKRVETLTTFHFSVILLRNCLFYMTTLFKILKC